ncbi:hypothetical protein MNBD_CHLOROFLEXI01-4258 [hydrothermal vent metagenome]|uniref:GCVT N-terminal domain-containing protein n=1 Tax=hydrothermal vent metagenome TaxID=652676 RepID=A0A3B0VK24_9ZZZZ
MNMRIITPIHEIAKQASAQFGDQSGWQIPEHYGSVENEVAAAQQDVVLVDQSHYGKIRIEGATAGRFLQGEALAIHAGMTTPYGYLFRLRQDLFFISTTVDNSANLVAKLNSQAKNSGDLVTITDVTQGNAALWLIGPKSKEVLSRLCPLDFDDSQFPDMTAKQSSVAKTKQLIIRRDIGETLAFVLIGARSSAAYLWQTIMEAGEDLDIQPAGLASTRDLM